MRFADIAGNEKAVQALRGMADSGRVAHAMLFYENDGCGAFPLAMAYLQYLNCEHPSGGDSCGECSSCRQMAKLIHPDVHFVYPVNTGTKSSSESKSAITSEYYLKYWRELVQANPYFTENDLMEAIGIEGKTGAIALAEAKSILAAMSLASVSGKYKAVVMYLPEKMNQVAANKLLKLVEEPPEMTIFIFICHSPEKVLQTIFSRCQSLRVMPLSRTDVEKVLTEEYGIPQEEAEFVSASSQGSVGRSVALLSDNNDRSVSLDMFMDMMNALLSGNLSDALDIGEDIAALPSRERQKSYCVFMTECLRNIFLLQNGMERLVSVPESEKEFYKSVAAKCRKSFCHKAITNIDKTINLLDRNVNSRILFADLMNRFFVTI